MTPAEEIELTAEDHQILHERADASWEATIDAMEAEFADGAAADEASLSWSPGWAENDALDASDDAAESA